MTPAEIGLLVIGSAAIVIGVAAVVYLIWAARQINGGRGW